MCVYNSKMKRPTFTMPKKLNAIVKKKIKNQSVPYKLFQHILKFKKNYQKIESFLRKVNPDFNEVNKNGRCLMAMMAEKKIIFEAQIKLAISRDLDLLMPIRTDSSTPLAVALIEKGGKKSTQVVLDELLFKKENVFAIKGDTFPHFLIRGGFTEAFRRTLLFVSDINMRNNTTLTLLHQAVEDFEFDMVKYLLEEGADVNAINFTGDTPLHIAANLGTKNKTAIIELLLQFDSDVNMRNFGGQTPFDVLGSSSRIEASAILMLLSAGSRSTEWTHSEKICHLCNFAEQIRKKTIDDKSAAMLLLHIQLKNSEDETWFVKNPHCFSYMLMRSHSKWKDLAIRFKDKIETLKNITLANTTITLWDIAMSPVEEIARFFINTKVMEAAISCEIANCSVLEYLIKTKIDQACKRRKFSLCCVPYMRKVLNLHLATPSLEFLAQHLEASALHRILYEYGEITGISIKTSTFFNSPISIVNQPIDIEIYEQT